MEIRYLTQEEKAASRALYEEIFVEDEKAFVDAYYEIKTADNQILAALEDGSILAMLHRNPYTFRFRGICVQADYLVAVATRRLSPSGAHAEPAYQGPSGYGAGASALCISDACGRGHLPAL